MDKRYQVFVSSTYEDLKRERETVIKAIWELGLIPAAMELFLPTGEKQWEIITRELDNCDYYVLIIGSQYGSLTPDGISYTEKEYDYAVSRKLNVLAFVHNNPDKIRPRHKVISHESRGKFDAFRLKVTGGHFVKFWTDPRKLPQQVTACLSYVVSKYPGIGWVRADIVADNAALKDKIRRLRLENKELKKA